VDTIDRPDWADNPRLNNWLAEQRAAFPAWCREHPGDWDFSPESVDRLEHLIRSAFSTWEEENAAERGPLVQGACWYLGELLVRHGGAVWRWQPWEPDPKTPSWHSPMLTYPTGALTDRERELLEQAEDDEDGDPDAQLPVVHPAMLVSSLFAAPGHSLREALHVFAGFAGWRARAFD